MQELVSTVAPRRQKPLRLIAARAGVEVPSLVDCCAALASSILLIISFPNFSLWPLAWVSLAPMLIVIARRPAPFGSFILAWITGSVFFYGSCYWLTYSMVHFGKLAPWLSYSLLAPGALILGLFPA